MEFELLIPGQEKIVAMRIVEYVENIFESAFPICKKIAKQIVTAKYWEARDSERYERQEYWRLVLMEFDSIDNFSTINLQP